MTMRKREVTELAILVAVLAGFGFLSFRLLEDYRLPVKEKYEAVTIGQTESEVRKRLGPPDHEYDPSTATANYYVSGYGRRERPISHRVLIYMDRDMILYVWIDADAKVEETFVGTS